MLEKLRLSTWKKTSVSAEKDKETKDGSRIFANNVSSVTKGVKFAVSMFIMFDIDFIHALQKACKYSPGLSDGPQIFSLTKLSKPP